MLWKGASVHWVEISFASERNPESKLAIQMPKIHGISESLDLCIVALCAYRVRSQRSQHQYPTTRARKAASAEYIPSGDTVEGLGARTTVV